MAFQVTIGGQIITFPSQGEQAAWAEGIDDFAQAVATQLSAISSPFDVSPRVQTLNSDINTDLPIAGALFPHTSVTAFNLSYAIYRTNTSTTVNEQGTLGGVYNPATSTWQLQQEYQGDRQSNGAQWETFSMSGDQLVITTVPIGGSYDGINSKISFFAKTNLFVNL